MRYILLALTIVATPAFSQVTRCETPSGVVYQQGACPGGRTLAATPPTPGLGPAGPGKALCERVAPSTFKEPESVRIESVARGGAHVVEVNGVKTPAVTYVMQVNARSTHGGYTGDKPYFCFVSQDESKVLKVSVSIL